MIYILMMQNEMFMQYWSISGGNLFWIFQLRSGKNVANNKSWFSIFCAAPKKYSIASSR
jgi:hypothetical protein